MSGRILVLGGDGFCGWPTALHLSKSGYVVAIVDNLSRRNIENELEAQSLTPIRPIGKRLAAWKALTNNDIAFHNIDVAAEYLVMAATLALIKSRMLLPSEQEDEDGEPIDPRAELVTRLLEYQRFKEAAETLSQRRLLGRDVFQARGPVLESTPESERQIEVGLYELIEAFRKVLEEARDAALIQQTGGGNGFSSSNNCAMRGGMSSGS